MRAADGRSATDPCWFLGCGVGEARSWVEGTHLWPARVTAATPADAPEDLTGEIGRWAADVEGLTYSLIPWEANATIARAIDLQARGACYLERLEAVGGTVGVPGRPAPKRGALESLASLAGWVLGIGALVWVAKNDAGER